MKRKFLSTALTYFTFPHNCSNEEEQKGREKREGRRQMPSYLRGGISFDFLGWKFQREKGKRRRRRRKRRGGSISVAIGRRRRGRRRRRRSFNFSRTPLSHLFPSFLPLFWQKCDPPSLSLSIPLLLSFFLPSWVGNCSASHANEGKKKCITHPRRLLTNNDSGKKKKRRRRLIFVTTIPVMREKVHFPI